MKNRLYWMMGLCALLVAALFVATRPKNALYTSVSDIQDRDRVAAVDRRYKISFSFDNKTGKVPAFLPRYENIEFNSAIEAAKLFGFETGDLSFEDDSEWVFEGEGKRLSIGKRLNTISYSQAPVGGGAQKADAQSAIAIAEDFCAATALPIDGEPMVTKTEDGYLVRFIRRLGPLPDYAFPTTFNISRGEALSAEYADLTYERLNSFSVRPMKDAFYDLPTDDDSSVDIKRVTLVYRLSESIMQPAYLFEGEYAQGGVFEYYVNAFLYYTP